MGGMLPAISTGYIQREIQQAAYEYQKAIESNERVIVGVNRFEIASQRAAIPSPFGPDHRSVASGCFAAGEGDAQERCG